MLTTNVTAK